MTLQEQILARICATQHRPPTHRDIIQALYPEPYLTIGAEIKAMLSAGIIDTENGDSGLTYTLKKSTHVPVEIPRTVTVCDHAGIAYFPSKKPNAQNRMETTKRLAASTKDGSSRIAATLLTPH